MLLEIVVIEGTMAGFRRGSKEEEEEYWQSGSEEEEEEEEGEYEYE